MIVFFLVQVQNTHRLIDLGGDRKHLSLVVRLQLFVSFVFLFALLRIKCVYMDVAAMGLIYTNFVSKMFDRLFMYCFNSANISCVKYHYALCACMCDAASTGHFCFCEICHAGPSRSPENNLKREGITL
eukprot:jgi/Bigna1/60091/fgenesh1_kg.9_\